MMNLDGVDIYQWARQEGMDAHDQKSQVYFSCKDGSADSSGQAYSEQEAIQLKSNMTMTGDVLFFNGTHAPSKKLAFITIRKKDELTVHVGNGSDPALLICA